MYIVMSHKFEQYYVLVHSGVKRLPFMDLLYKAASLKISMQ